VPSLKDALKGVETGYYLIHSMRTTENYRTLDRDSVENFWEACIASGVKRIIYLGGLRVKENASEHLLSRIETREILSARPDRIQTIWMRAGVTIGSGSASFEIIRNLCQKLPMMITPHWVRSRTQPIVAFTAYLDTINHMPFSSLSFSHSLCERSYYLGQQLLCQSTSWR